MNPQQYITISTWTLYVLQKNFAFSLTSLRKKSPTSKRGGAPAPVKVGDEFRLALANEYDRIWLERTPSERREA